MLKVEILMPSSLSAVPGIHSSANHAQHILQGYAPLQRNPPAILVLRGETDLLAAEIGGLDADAAPLDGDLGFVALHTLEPKIANAARTMKRGTISGILESRDAFQMVLVHEYRAEGVESFEAAMPSIREFVMAREARKVMDAVMKKTDELRASGKVEIFAENLR